MTYQTCPSDKNELTPPPKKTQTKTQNTPQKHNQKKKKTTKIKTKQKACGNARRRKENFLNKPRSHDIIYNM